MAENNVIAIPRAVDPSLVARFLSAPSASPHRAIVEVSGTPFPPLIDASDLVCVDFTCTRLMDDALYIVAIEYEAAPWIGIRRFTKRGTGWFMSDDSSGTEPYPLTGAALRGMQVIGRVMDVFKAGWLSS